jgi:protein farnesyltransferase/geranylgeranyltransferase type-1 subunit alpha
MNYNFWIIRRNILKNFNYDSFKELVWIEEMILKYPKNFLGWYHRKLIANANLSCVTLACELRLTECVLQHDAKNYFAYNHRQWAINTFKYENLGLLKMESKFTAQLIDEDVRNNSAWSHRFFVIKQRGKCDPILVKNEMQYVLGKINEVNANESAWNYLRGLLTCFGTKKLYQFQDVIDFCEHEYFEKKNYTPQIVAFLIDVKIEMVLDDVMVDNMINAQKIYELCMAMASRHDKIRKNYWKYVYKQFYYDKIMKRMEKKDDEVQGGIKEDESWKEKIGKKQNLNDF